MRLSPAAVLVVLPLFGSTLFGGEVHGACWIDRNGDGIRQAGEPGISDQVMYVINDADQSIYQSAQTNADGSWQVTGIPNGSYRISYAPIVYFWNDEHAELAYSLTAMHAGADGSVDSDLDPVTRRSAALTMTAGTSVAIDAGFITEAGVVSGRIWLDADKDGTRDAGESTVSGPSGSVLVMSVSEPWYGGTFPVRADGTWNSCILPPGSYSVRKSLASNAYRLTAPNVGDDALDSDFTTMDAAAPLDCLGTTTIASSDPQVDLGLIDQRGSISGRVWRDANRNGVQDAGEARPYGYIGVNVSGVLSTTLPVDGDGSWSTGPINPGTYEIQFYFDNLVHRLTAPDVGSDSQDSDASSASYVAYDGKTVLYGTKTVTVLESHPVVDAGYLDQRGTISGRVWFDANKDGLRQPSETVLPPSATVSIESLDNGSYVPAPSVAADGTWSTGLVLMGSYRVRVNLLESIYGFTVSNAGDDAKDSDVVVSGNPNAGTCDVTVSGTSPVVDAGTIDRRATISGRVWLDEDMDGQQDAGEATPIRGFFTVSSLTTSYSYHAMVPADGRWTTPLLAPGQYVVSLSLPSGAGIFTTANVGDDATDSDLTLPFAGSSYASKLVTIAGGANLILDAGVVNQPGSIAGRLWYDRNADGIRSADEGALAYPGHVFILPNGGNEVQVGIAADGTWSYGPTTPGPTRVRVVPGSGLRLSPVVAGGGSKPNPTSGEYLTNVIPGTTVQVDAGLCGPTNDHFADALPIAQAPQDTNGAVWGMTSGSTHETGEPRHYGHVGTGSVWYAWTAPAAGRMTITTAGSSFDTLLGVYTGSAVNALTRIAANDDRTTGDPTSKVAFFVAAGTTYRIAVDGDGAPGNVALAWTFNAYPQNDDFGSAITLGTAAGTLNASTVLSSHESGEPKHYGHAGTGSIWYAWTAPAAGRMTITTFLSSFDTLLGVYTGTAVGALTKIAANDDRAAGDPISQVAFTAVPGTTYRIAVDGDGVQGAVTLSWGFIPFPLNDAFADAVVLAEPTGTLNTSTVLGTHEAGEPKHYGHTGTASIWYSWTAPASGKMTITTAGSDFDTLLGIYTGSAVNALSKIAGNDDRTTGDQTSKVTFTATAGTTYRIAVDGDAAPGAVTLNWSFVPTGSG